MGKPTGFIDYLRELPADRAPLERARDWGEFHYHMPEDKLRTQGARCMDCGVPFCHTGTLISGMASGCPINNLIPEWNDLVFRGLWKEALERLHKTNNFPEFTGRVCPAPCEGSCVLGINAPPVTIKNLEVSIIDRGWEAGWVTPQPPPNRTGEKSRGHRLRSRGPVRRRPAQPRRSHRDRVRARGPAGRAPTYGIPNMKLDKEQVVLRRIRVLEAEGVNFACNTEVGVNYPAENLGTEFDATVICTGATKPRDLPIEGRALRGVHFAMDFLTANTKSILDQHQNGDFIFAGGKDVVIIGGGDTGTDCVGTAMRHGCRSLVQLEILPKPPMDRAADNPWPEWPKVYKLDYGQEEAAARFGEDPRVYLTTATSFESDDNGQIKAVHTVQVEWSRNDKGQFIPKNVPGTEKILPAQLVLLAMGFLGPEQPLLDALGVERDARSNIKAEHEKYTTSLPGVFAAGDCRRGQSLVVWAFNEGRGAARECDRYLMGSTDLP